MKILQPVFCALFVSMVASIRAQDENLTKTMTLPEKVQSVLKREAPDAEIHEVEVETKAGVKVFSVEVERGEASSTFEITADGLLLEREAELEHRLLPSIVAKAINRRLGKCKIQECSWKQETLYEVKWQPSKGDEAEELLLDGLGERISLEEEAASVSQLPPAVRAALLRAKSVGAQVEVEAEPAVPTAVYELEVRTEAGESSTKMTAEGDLIEIEVEVSMADLPAMVQAKVKSLLAGGRIIELERVHRFSYEVEVSRQGKEFDVEVSPTGQIFEVERE